MTIQQHQSPGVADVVYRNAGKTVGTATDRTRFTAAALDRGQPANQVDDRRRACQHNLFLGDDLHWQCRFRVDTAHRRAGDLDALAFLRHRRKRADEAKRQQNG